MPSTEIAIHDYRPSGESSCRTGKCRQGDALNLPPEGRGPYRTYSSTDVTREWTTRNGFVLPALLPYSATCDVDKWGTCWRPSAAFGTATERYSSCTPYNGPHQTWVIYDLGRPRQMEWVSVSLTLRALEEPILIDACSEVGPKESCLQVQQNSWTYSNDHCTRAASHPEAPLNGTQTSCQLFWCVYL